MPDYSALFQPMFWCRFSLIKHILFVFICFRFDKISNSWLTLKWVCQFMSIKSCPAVEVELQVVRLGSWFSTTLRIQLGPWASSWFLGCYYSSTLCIYLKKKPPWKVTIICCTYLLWQRHATAQCMRLGRRTTCKSLFSLLHYVSSRQHIQVVRHLYPLSCLASAQELRKLFTHKSLLPTLPVTVCHTHSTWIYCCTFIYPSFLSLFSSPFIVLSTLSIQREAWVCSEKVLNWWIAYECVCVG